MSIPVREFPGHADTARDGLEAVRAMYDETSDDGKRRYTVAAIAAEFGITRPTVYRQLGKPAPAAG